MWLFNCLDEELGDAVLQANTNPAPKDMSEQAHLLSIMSLAVKKESKLVQRIKLGRTSSPLGYPSETTWLHYRAWPDSVSTPSSARTAPPWWTSAETDEF